MPELGEAAKDARRAIPRMVSYEALSELRSTLSVAAAEVDRTGEEFWQALFDLATASGEDA